MKLSGKRGGEEKRFAPTIVIVLTTLLIVFLALGSANFWQNVLAVFLWGIIVFFLLYPQRR